MTFSIAAADLGAPGGPQWGVAVASKFLAAGAVVPWARADAGAIATQALANVAYGPEGLERLAAGASAAEVVGALAGADPDADQRQIGVVDAAGRAAMFTGRECLAWAGGRTGDTYCCQGNILAGPGVVDAMAAAFEGAAGRLAHRLMAALTAGFEAGGDRRGMQSAAILVVRPRGGYLGGNDRAMDLRVDDHPRAPERLGRLLQLHELYFPPPGSLRFTPIDEALADEIRGRLRALGHPPPEATGYDDGLRRALFDWVGAENLEERWSEDAAIEVTVLDVLRRGGP